MKKIAFIVPSFPKLSETFIVNKFRGLLVQGWDVRVVCGKTDEKEWRNFEFLNNRKDIKQRVLRNWPHRPRWFAALLIPFALLRCLCKNPKGTFYYLRKGWKRFGCSVFRYLYLDADIISARPDLIHFEFGALAVGQMHIGGLIDSKIVVSFRGYDLNLVGLDDPSYYKDVWDKANHLHLLGQDLWRRAQRRGCPPNKKHTVIPPAIDTAFFDPCERKHLDVVGSPGRPLRILSVGRLDWRKGYDYTLQAIHLLIKRDIYCLYHIIGDGNYIEPVSFARHQLDLGGKVDLLGAQPPSKVKEQMLWADVFLHAAVSEGFCNAVMEAQAMCLPVVSADAGGLSENVADKKTGFIVPKRNPQSLTDKLFQLAQDPKLRGKMGKAGRQRVLNKFQLKDQIADFEKMYKQVLGY